MTIPSTGPLPPRRMLVARRDRRPDALLVCAAITTAAVIVIVLSSAAVGELHGWRLAASLVLAACAVLSLTAALWLVRPRMLREVIDSEPEMPTVGPSDRGSVSPDADRGSWPFRS